MNVWNIVAVVYLVTGLSMGAWWWSLLKGDLDEGIEGSEVHDVLCQIRFAADNDPRGLVRLLVAVIVLCVVLLWPLVALSMIFAKPGESR